MAKKKVSHAQNDKPLQKQPHQETPPSLLDSEKFERLKSLNQMLLIEAVERRQQVDSLLQSKGSVETELTRSNSERDALESELARLVERTVKLEVETVFVSVQVGVRGEEFGKKMKGSEMEMRKWKRESEEKENEIVSLNGTLREIEGALGNEREVLTRVRVERDDFKDKLNRQIEEDEGLRANLTDLDGKMRKMEREIEELRTAYNGAVREKKDMEMRIQLVMGERDLCEMESNKLIEKMKEEISDVVSVKGRVEKENSEEIIKRREAENVVNGLNEMVTDLQKEEIKLQRLVSELEKKCIEGDGKLKEAEMEIGRLVEETKLSEKRIQSLIDDKSVAEMDLSKALNQLAEQKLEIENLANEKIVILDDKNRVDGEVGKLRNHVDELKSAVLNLKEFNLTDVEKISSLESEVGEYKRKLEKQNALKLKEKIQELEMKVSESHKSAGELKSENAAILTEKVELERRCELQRKEISSLQEAVLKVRDEYDSMKAKEDLSDANSEMVLNMLKGTSAFCSNEGEDQDLLVDGEEVKPHVMELERIKSAFKSKAGKMDDMKRELELMQSCVVDAEKKKRSFLTVLSSAVTLVGAASVAYFASGH